MDKTRRIQVRHLWEVEGLSVRQIAKKLHMSRKTVSQIIGGEKTTKPSLPLLITPYERLIGEWYRDYPFLKATQVYERLKEYDFQGSYETVKRGTMRFRQKRRESFHALEFLPGEEAQIDWMEWRIPEGPVYGFMFLLAWSRYLCVKFYLRHSLEFFLDGHLEAYREIKGIARRNRYDNLKSVVIQRRPELKLNPQFLDFSIHLCSPRRANEKGRVERVIRDAKNFLRVTPVEDLKDLNRKITFWRRERNNRIHRSTGRTPADRLREEKLKPLPQIGYRPYRVVVAGASKTGFVEFETNRYSVPSQYCGMSCEILALPDSLEVLINGRKVAAHRRLFERKKKKEDPSHREKLLSKTPRFKLQRIYQLMTGMAKEVEHFLKQAEQEG
jgi:transposase